MEGLLDDSGNLPHVLDEIGVLDKGGHRAGDVYLLENIAAQQVALHLPGNGHDGNGIHIGGGDSGDQVGGARAGGHHADPNLAGDPGIAGSHMAGVLLGAYQRIVDVRGGQCVYRRADGGPGVAEQLTHTLSFQAFDQRLCASHHSNSSLEVCFICRGPSGTGGGLRQNQKSMASS